MEGIESFLMLSTLGKISADGILTYFSLKTGFDISGKNKKKYHQFIIYWISLESVKVELFNVLIIILIVIWTQCYMPIISMKEVMDKLEIKLLSITEFLGFSFPVIEI